MGTVIIKVLRTLLGYSDIQLIVAILTGQVTLPEAGSPQINEYELLKREIGRSRQFTPCCGPGTWRYNDRPATLTFEDKTYKITLKGVSGSTGKHFQYAMSINQMVELRDMLSRSPENPRAETKAK